MAQQGNKGLIARWLEGKERSEDYARSTLPTNRWSLFWDIFKGRFGKLVIINLLVLVTFLPLIAVYAMRYIALFTENAIGPYGSSLMVGYPAMFNVAGYSESQVFWMDLTFFSLFILTGAIAAVGIAGGMYITRNLIWTEGVFVANDFLRGIKRNYWNVLEAVLVFTVLLFMTQTMQNLANLNIVTTTSKATVIWMTVSKVMGYVFLAMGLLVSFWMVSLGINYKQGPWVLFRNAVILTVGTLPQTIFFVAIALIPFLIILFLGSSMLMIGILLLIFLSFSFTMLVWMNYSQWAFDRFINPKLGVATGKGLYNKDGKKDTTATPTDMQESEALKQYRRMIVAQGRSKLVCRPIKPLDDELEVYQLPDSFSRDDLKRLKESKEKIEEDAKAYVEEHQNDEQYVEYNREFDERERALREEEEDGKKKKKPKNPPKMLNKR